MLVPGACKIASDPYDGKKALACGHRRPVPAQSSRLGPECELRFADTRILHKAEEWRMSSHAPKIKMTKDHS